MADYYIAGTISLTNGSAAIVGTGTAWQIANVVGGTVFVQGAGNPLPLASIEDDTHAMAALAWTGATGSYSYALLRATAFSEQLEANSNIMSRLLVGLEAGTLYRYDATGDTADRSTFDGRPEGFAFLAIDVSPAQLYIKASATSGDWAGPFAYGVGPTGPQGPKGMNWRGNWSAATAYLKDDAVFSNNASWIALVDNTNVAPVAGATWGQVAARGGTGATGTSFTYRGVYSAATAYAINDIVQDNQSSWIAVAATTGNAPPVLPTTSNTWWQLVAAKGTNGTGTGDVVGPTGAVADRIAVFNGTTGKLLKDGGKLVSDMVNKSGDTMTGGFTINAGFPIFELRPTANDQQGGIRFSKADGTANWQLIDDGPTGSLSLSMFNDAGGFQGNVLRLDDNGDVGLGLAGVSAPSGGGFKTVRSILVGGDLDTLTDAGVYDGSALTNAPFPSSDWWYVEVLRHSQADTFAIQRAALLTGGDRGSGAVWTRKRRGVSWSPWEPVGGRVTPAHYGATRSDSAGEADSLGTDDTVTIQRWLSSPYPLLLDGWYRITAPVTADITGRQGFTIQGCGARSGILLEGTGSVVIQGGDQDNPFGFNFDTVTLKDFNLLYTYDSSTIPLKITFADGDSGSVMPGIDMDNVHVLPASTAIGAQDALILLRNVRQGNFKNVSGGGKYFQYLGDFIRCEQGAGSATVEMVFTNCRAAHFKRGFVLKRADGSTANDDSQGYHWTNCTIIAVDRGWDLDGGADGFGEWYTFTKCHAYFREIGIFGVNTGNCRVEGGYFLGHGSLATIQGVALSGSSIVSASIIMGLVIKLDAATGANRFGLNLPSTMSGSAAFCRTIGATNAYGNVASSWIRTDCL